MPLWVVSNDLPLQPANADPWTVITVHGRGFAAGLLGGAFLMDIDVTVGLAVGGTVATLALIVVFVEWTLSMGA